MRYKFFTIPVLNIEQAEIELNNFCRQHRIAQIDKQFVSHADAEKSFWAICVTWLEGDGSMPKAVANSSQRKPKVDYKEVLNDNDFHLFSQLRDLRKALAAQEGTAVYNIFTNEQLALIVQQNIQTKTALAKLDGVGVTRVNKYGEQFINHLQKIKNNEA